MEDFVPYKLAVKLKEKGFPQHITDDAYIIDNYGEEEYDIGERLPIPLVPDYMDDVAAPTIFQVLKWLREERKVVVSMNPYYGKFVNVHWWWDIRTPVYKVEICNNIKQEGFDSYELAALAGIEYVIDNLI